MSLSRNTGLVIGGTVLPLLVNVVTVPIYIGLIGSERYGALLIAWVLLGYFGQVDFGIGRAITQRLATADKNDGSRLADAVWSALASAALFSGLAGLALYVIGGTFFGRFFLVDHALRSELLQSLWMLALCTPVVALGGVVSGALQGLDRFGLSSAGTLIGNLGLQILPILTALVMGPQLGWLIGASLTARILGMMLPAFGVWRSLLSGFPVRPSRDEFRRLARFGSWIMVTALVSPLMISSDRFVIGTLAGAAAVAAYSIPFQIAARTTILPISLSQALFPRFAAMSEADSRTRCAEATVFVGQSYAPICIGLICLASPLLHLWLGDKLDSRSIIIGQVVLAGFWANAVANVPYAFIQARGQPRFTAILHLAELPLYVLLLFALGSRWGLAGFAAAYGLRCALDCAVLMVKAGVWSHAAMRALAGPALLVLAAIIAGQVLQAWLAATTAAAVLCAASGILAWLQMPLTVREALAGLPLVNRLVPASSRP